MNVFVGSARGWYCTLLCSLMILCGSTQADEIPDANQQEFESREEYILWFYYHGKVVNQIMAKFKPGIEPRPRALIAATKAKELSGFLGRNLTPIELMSGDDWQMLQLDERMTQAEVEELCKKLRQHPDIIYADPNGSVFTNSVASDPRFQEQWSLGAGVGSANVQKAWDLTTGSANGVVAVIDTGIVSHEDIDGGRVLVGYDFISDPSVANDGDGRDGDATDAGTWITQAEHDGQGIFSGCTVGPSLWHGTHVAGVVAASANNSKGIAGIDWSAKVLPVRAIGKCRGDSRDIIEAIKWAAGVNEAIAGVTRSNSSPARVINLSLSGSGSCIPALQEAIDKATAKGALVVASAGNKGVSGSFYPANCQNVLTVVATDKVGNRAPFSNFGSSSSMVSAPGVDILSTVNPGTTTPTAGSAYAAYAGTSQAAAIVSGIASLMVAVKPELTPFEIRQMILGTAKPFSVGSYNIGDCGAGSCGRGLVDAAAAVTRAMAHQTCGEPYCDLVTPDGDVFSRRWVSSGWAAYQAPYTDTHHTLVGLTALGDGLLEILFKREGAQLVAYSVGSGDDGGYSPQIGPPQARTYTPVRNPFFDDVKSLLGVLNGSWTSSTQIAIKDDGSVWMWGDTGCKPTFYSGKPPEEAYDLPYENCYAGSIPAKEEVTLYFPPQIGPILVLRAPKMVPNLPPIKKVANDGFYFVAITEEGRLWVWGWDWAENSYPFPPTLTLPYPYTDWRYVRFYSAVEVPEIQDVNQIAVYGGVNTILKNDGTVWRWGGTDLLHRDLHQVNVDRVVSLAGNGQLVLRQDGSLVDIGYNEWDKEGTPVTVVQSGVVYAASNSSTVMRGNGTVTDLSYSNATKDWYISDLMGVDGEGTFNVAMNDTAQTDLHVGISGTAAVISVGQSVGLDVSISNMGRDVATNSVVSIATQPGLRIVTLPPGCTLSGNIARCDLGNLGSNSSYSLTFQAEGVVAPDVATVMAFASSDRYDFDLTNNTAGLSVNVDEFVGGGGGEMGDVPIPLWAIVALGAGLTGSLARRQPAT